MFLPLADTVLSDPVLSQILHQPHRQMARTCLLLRPKRVCRSANMTMAAMALDLTPKSRYTP